MSDVLISRIAPQPGGKLEDLDVVARSYEVSTRTGEEGPWVKRDPATLPSLR